MNFDRICVDNCGIMWISLLKSVENSKLVPHFQILNIISYLILLRFYGNVVH